ncbi:MAG: tyrosine-protein phosphatase [Thermoanaerobaculia bacterium]
MHVIFFRSGIRRWSLIALALAAAVLGLGYARYAAFRPAEVLPGVYRSEQPDAHDLRAAVARHGIRSVINLRGPVPKEAWYREEVAATRALGLARRDLSFETFDWPPKIETSAFIRAYESLPHPILLHCESGIDRTGWASATALLLEGASVEEARRELTLLRGHFCTGGCPLHAFFDEYEQWLAASSAPHSAARFRRWALEAYAPGPYDARLALLDPFPGILRPGEEVVVDVEVENRSPEIWPAGGGSERKIGLGARMLGPFATVPGDILWRFRQPLSPAADVFRSGMEGRATKPGEIRRIPLRFTAPAEPGVYALQIDMVDEHVNWFSNLGGPGLLVEFRVAEGETNG